MEMDFYAEWLGIPADQRPPNHYQLLGIPPFTTDLQLVEKAARERARLLKGYEIGKYSSQSQVLLTEIARSRADLLNPKRKAEYDKRLRGGEKAPQIEMDSIEIFKNLVAFSMPRGNLSKEHIASLFAEAKRLRIPEDQAKGIVQPLLLQAKKVRQEELAAKEAAQREEEKKERAAQKRATAKKVALVVVVVALVGAAGAFLLKLRTASQEEREKETVLQQKRETQTKGNEFLAKAEKAEKQQSWQEAAANYEKAAAISSDEKIKAKLAAVREVLRAIDLEAGSKWAEAAAAYRKGREGLGDARLFEDKLASLSVLQSYEESRKEAETKEKEGKLQEACAAYEKALDAARKAKIPADLEKRMAAVKDRLASHAATTGKAKHLIEICIAQKDPYALLAAANYYLAGAPSAEVRGLAEKGRADAENGIKGSPDSEKRKPEEILGHGVLLVKDGKCFHALHDLGRLESEFRGDRLWTDAAYQAEVMKKADKDAPKSIQDLLAKCVTSCETMCPSCLGTGRLPCPDCGDTGKVSKRCEACNGAGAVRGCPECLSTGVALGPCFECKGTGAWKCPKCGGSRAGCKFCQYNSKRACTECKGTGKAPTRRKCPACNGKGKIGDKTCEKCMGKGRPLCDVCKGTGKKPCEVCKGTGKIEAPCPRCSKGQVRRCAVCGGTGREK